MPLALPAQMLPVTEGTQRVSKTGVASSRPAGVNLPLSGTSSTKFSVCCKCLFTEHLTCAERCRACHHGAYPLLMAQAAHEQGATQNLQGLSDVVPTVRSVIQSGAPREE